LTGEFTPGRVSVKGKTTAKNIGRRHHARRLSAGSTRRVAENLHRAELTAADRAAHIAEWIRLTEAKEVWRATRAAFGPPFLLASVPNSVEIGRQGRVAAVGEHASNLLRQDTF
jgi:hypothetical protein